MKKQLVHPVRAWLLGLWLLSFLLCFTPAGLLTHFALAIALSVVAVLYRKDRGLLRWLCFLPLAALAALMLLMAVLMLLPAPRENIDVDYQKAKLVSEYDTHGGFHGDGVSCRSYRVDEALAERLEQSEYWRDFPLAEEVELLVYGNEDGGQYVQSDGLTSPRIAQGRWYFRDRFPQAADPYDERAVFTRAAFNFTVGLYDREQKLLHVLKMDT